jgi:hypothetical protein
MAAPGPGDDIHDPRAVIPPSSNDHITRNDNAARIKDLTLYAIPPATQLPIATLKEWKKRDRVLNDSGINSMITSRPLWEPGRAQRAREQQPTLSEWYGPETLSH